MKRYTFGIFSLLVLFVPVLVCSPSFSHAQTQFKSKEIGEVALRLTNLKADLADAQQDLSDSIFSQPLGGGKLRIYGPSLVGVDWVPKN